MRVPGARGLLSRPHLCPHFPRCQILHLLLRQRIDLHPHAGEFEARDFLVDHRRDRIDLLLCKFSQVCRLFYHSILATELWRNLLESSNASCSCHWNWQAVNWTACRPKSMMIIACSSGHAALYRQGEPSHGFGIFLLRGLLPLLQRS